jgi:D-alanyl-D-alanine carboxypeptidase/D-alanyl-D-alanine-endopeptidase (penicillin-binding protein 4)
MYLRAILILIITLLFNFKVLAESKSAFEGGLVGYRFTDLNSGKVLAEKNANKLFMPASTQKIFTALAAEQILGMDYVITNDISYTGEVTGGILEGDIVITFRGNPFFTKQDINDMAVTTRAHGINQINGKIIIDDTYFDYIKYPHGWSIENKYSGFMSPILAISVNKNSEYVVTKRVDDDAVLKYDKRLISIDSQVDFGTCELHDLELYGDDTNCYKLFGCHKEDKELPNLRVAIQNPRAYAMKIIDVAFNQSEIGHNGIALAKNSKETTMIKQYHSPSLKKMLKDVMVNSNNHVAEIITKTMGRHAHQSGSWKAGTHAIKEAIVQAGLIDCNHYFYDGSGLSKKDLVSPDCFVKLLALLAERNSHIIKLLPKANQGTLSGRFGDLPATYSVRAKTGTLSGVSALAGYIEQNGKRIVAFAIATNNFPECMEKEVKKGEEELILEIINQLE